MVLVPLEELPLYQSHTARVFAELNPTTQAESELAQRIANTEWRLNRIARLEAGVYLAAKLRASAPIGTDDPAVHTLLTETRTFTQSRQITQLARQESRLRHYRTSDLRDFARLRDLRTASPSPAAPHRAVEATPGAFGTEVSVGSGGSEFELLSENRDHTAMVPERTTEEPKQKDEFAKAQS